MGQSKGEIMRIEAVDLFCGVGGLTAGLIKAGINVRAGYDIANDCRFAYEFNNNATFVNKDVATIDASEVSSWYSEGAIKLLAGCAPCQPFSTYNQGKDTTTDKKWPLLYHFSRLIREIQPELVTMENVPHVIKHEVYHDFVSNLIEQGYEVFAQEVLCADYGIPQNRRRHVLLASRIGKIKLIEPTHKDNHVTLREAIGNLPKLSHGQQDSTDYLHKCSRLNSVNLKRIQHSKPGGTWKDWPESLILDCHKKESGSTYASVYGRMEWDKPSPTMTTQCFGYGNGRFGHPEQDRAISLREAAILQSFPDSYQFWPDKNISMKAVGKMVGNAVPVRLGEIIGHSFMNSLNSFDLNFG